VCGVLAAAAPLCAAAQSGWPARPVRMVVPYAAGGATDVIARLLAEAMSQRLPQRILVENRTGAGGTLGAAAVARGEADGHLLLFHNIGHAAAPALYARLDYAPAEDLRAVTVVAESPMVLLVPPSSPFRSLAELVAFARANPGRLSYGSTGGGGALQLVTLLLMRAAGVQLTEVAYRGGAPAATDLAAGTLDILYDAGLTGFALAREGRARALAVSGPERSPVMPEVPTVAEAGFPAATFMVWQAVLAPRATPEPVVAAIHAAAAAALADPALARRLAELGAERLPATPPAEADRFVAGEIARWTAILREAGLRPQ
jgi:tripartite-type tricarboxylate transporter receptor subunit TctC